jgi:dCTP deaminase
MVLTDRVIEAEILKGNIVIQGYKSEHLNPNSYDLTLAPTCKIYHPKAIGDNKQWMKTLNEERLDEWLEWSHKIASDPNWYLDTKDKNIPTFEFDIPSSGFILQSNHYYLYSCNEIIGVKHNICASVMGKSSLGRLAMEAHICAGFVDTGFAGSLVLEMRSEYPLKVYPDMKICQVKFERTEGVPGESYDMKPGSKYMNQVGVQESKMGHNWNETFHNPDSFNLDAGSIGHSSWTDDTGPR